MSNMMTPGVDQSISGTTEITRTQAADDAEQGVETVTLTVEAYARLAKPTHLIDKPDAELARLTGTPGRALCGASLAPQAPMSPALVEAWCKGCLAVAGVVL